MLHGDRPLSPDGERLRSALPDAGTRPGNGRDFNIGSGLLFGVLRLSYPLAPWFLGDNADLEPGSGNPAIAPAREIEEAAPTKSRDCPIRGGPLVNIRARLKHAVASLCYEIPYAHRAPAIEMMVYIIRLIRISDGLAWNDKDEPPAFFDFGPQLLEFAERVKGVFEGIVGNGNITHQIGDVLGACKDFDASPSGLFQCRRIHLDPEFSSAVKLLEQVAAAATEVQHVVGRLYKTLELGKVRPPAKRTNGGLPGIVGLIVVF